MEAKEKEIYTIPRTCSRTPTDLRETKIDNQGIDYQKVDTSAQIEQTDNNSNGDVSKHPFCLFSVAMILLTSRAWAVAQFHQYIFCYTTVKKYIIEL